MVGLETKTSERLEVRTNIIGTALSYSLCLARSPQINQRKQCGICRNDKTDEIFSMMIAKVIRKIFEKSASKCITSVDDELT